MTTDTELRDLLTAEAGGPVTSPAGWDDVVRRGRHRQRVRRAQHGALAALAVGVVVAGVALSGGDPTVETTPPATDPATTPGYETTTSTAVTVPGNQVHSITAARAQGVFVTVIIPAADPSAGFDPCTALQARVVESAEQIGIELVDEDVEGAEPLSSCLSSAFSGRAMVELTDPVGDRPLVDLSTGDEVEVVDGASLLFPTELPEPFTAGVWDEFAFDGSWTFSWSAGDAYANVTTSQQDHSQCGEPIQVRGADGCRAPGSGTFVVWWQEGDLFHTIELGVVDTESPAPFTVDDVLAIAEGLEPYSEAGPEALGT